MTHGLALNRKPAFSRSRHERANLIPMPSRLPITLAWKNLTESKKRLATSLAGAAFAVVLMFMENGFRNASWTARWRPSGGSMAISS